MTTKITGEGLVLNTSDTLNVGGISSSTPIKDNAPAFSAYQSVAQSITSGTLTKVTLTSEEYNTSGAYNTTNSRFTPQVAGYYQVNARVGLVGTSTFTIASIYKNGLIYKQGPQAGSPTGTGLSPAISTLVYLDGSTDYIELWVSQTSGDAINTVEGTSTTYFNGVLVRAV